MHLIVEYNNIYAKLKKPDIESCTLCDSISKDTLETAKLQGHKSDRWLPGTCEQGKGIDCKGKKRKYFEVMEMLHILFVLEIA